MVNNGVVSHRRAVEAIALVVGWLAVDEIVLVVAIDSVPDLESTIHEEVLSGIVLARALCQHENVLSQLVITERRCLAYVIVIDRVARRSLAQPIAVEDEVPTQLVSLWVDTHALALRAGLVVHDGLAVPGVLWQNLAQGTPHTIASNTDVVKTRHGGRLVERWDGMEEQQQKQKVST